MVLGDRGVSAAREVSVAREASAARVAWAMKGEMRDLSMLNISSQEWSAPQATEVSVIRVRMREAWYGPMRLVRRLRTWGRGV